MKRVRVYMTVGDDLVKFLNFKLLKELCEEYEFKTPDVVKDYFGFEDGRWGLIQFDPEDIEQGRILVWDSDIRENTDFLNSAILPKCFYLLQVEVIDTESEENRPSYP